MVRLRTVFGVVAIWCLMSPALRAAEGAEYTIRSTTNEVRLVFSATDREGKRVSQLTPRDVAVVDNGEIIRRFRSFRTTSEAPVHMVILIDASESLNKQLAHEVEETKQFLASSQWGERDQVSVLVLGGTKTVTLCRVNCRQDPPQALDGLTPSGVTPLWDALIEAVGLLEQTRDSESRSAIVLFSDGVDTYSRNNSGTPLVMAQSMEATIYAVNSRAKKADDRGDWPLYQMAQQTGGIYYAPGQGTAQALNAVLEDLHSGFMLTYELPPSSGAEHSVRLLSTLNPRLQLRSRQGYRESVRR